MRLLLLALALLIPVATFAQHSHSPRETERTSLAVGVGDVNHPVSTVNADVQGFFNQGLANIYAFNHEESVRSFKRAAELDPQVAMVYWGIALSLGSNYN